jgi:hypothetical protein
MKRKRTVMIKKSLSAMIMAMILLLPLNAQVKKQQSELKREVTLYNPYKPSLFDAKKKSYLPEITDTARVTPSFSYKVVSEPFSPTYTINPIKPASLLSDPLSKLYKGYVKLGIGNYTTPLAELSISGTRSKKGVIGLYARHYSSNGEVPIPNSPRVFAGFMDNNASLYGKKFFPKNLLDISMNFENKARYAYGFDTDIPIYMYIPVKKQIKTSYYDIGAKASLSSLNLDSADFSYDFSAAYDFMHYTNDYTVNHTAFSGSMSKLFKGFYAGAGLAVDHYKLSDTAIAKPKYIISANPFVRKSTEQWGFNLGLKIVLERNLATTAKFHFYPDINFGFSVVQEYMRFFAELSGRLENNQPMKVFDENPFMIADGSIFRVPNTTYPLIVTAGLRGNNGLGGNYLASVSYSVVNDMLFFSNIIYPDTVMKIERGNHFILVPDDVEVLNIHGEMSGAITNKLSFIAAANFYKYTLSANEYAWNKPNWDGKLGFTYNLRNKIIAGTELTLLGKRKLLVSQSQTGWTTLQPIESEKPAHANLSLSAEYRYTKILSFWVKVNNISYDRYYEWAYYPSQMFNFLIGFSYSL